MTKGYWSLATIAARWQVCEDTARERLAGCPRIRIGRAVRYSIEGVEAIEARLLVRAPTLIEREKRRPPVDEEELALMRRYGRA